MTASRNKASRAVTAALVGVLSVGAVPMVAVAAESGATPLFVSPEGAFSTAKVVDAQFYHGDSQKPVDATADGVWTTEYDRNEPVTLHSVTVEMLSGDEATAKFTIDFANDNEYSVEYYKRDTKTDQAVDDPITGDVVDAGSYVAKVTALEGSDYAGGVIYVPFDITPVDISSIRVEVDGSTTYDAEAKDVNYYLGDIELLPGQDIDVTWYRTGNDTSVEYQADEVRDAGTYRALISGTGNYTGSVTLSKLVEVDTLDLSADSVVFPDVMSESTTEPTVPEYVLIEGRLYGPDSAIIGELQAELSKGTDVWYYNGGYKYDVTKADPTDANITGVGELWAFKYDQLLSWTYGGEALENYQEIIIDPTDESFDPNKVVATDAKGNKYTYNKDLTYQVIDDEGVDVTNDDWQGEVGTYTVIFGYNDNGDYSLGGNIVLTVHVYKDVVDADATVAVSYDGKVVTSVEHTYDGRDIKDDIRVTVKDDGNNVLNDYNVTYYDANGNRVSEIRNAGTYTLRVTSDTYKLTGTTEMTITVSPVTIGAVSSAELKTKSFDHAGVSAVTYLPWYEGGYAVVGGVSVKGLNLYYVDEAGERVFLGDIDGNLLNSVIKATIHDAEGDVVDTINDEGVYTITFEARNSDAENNYVMPGDLTIECIKESHLLYADVTYRDYFADAVYDVNQLGVMSGYTDAQGNAYGVFGATDSLTRGQVATVLYRLANGEGFVETEPVYNELFGYDTGFDDCDGKAFYAQAVAWAKSVGLVEGYVDGTFRPNQAISRQEFATMLKNYEQLFGDYEAGDESLLDQFDDADEAADWAIDDLAWAVSEGILRGNEEGELMPADSIIRADAAVMISRYVG